MDNIALSIGNINIYWYSIFITLGVIVAYLLIIKESKKQNLNIDDITDIIFNTLISGFIGARLYYVLFNIKNYIDNPIDIIKIWNGGLAIHGGIILGLIALILTCKKKKINFLKMTDIAVPGLIIAQAIGRWGNFFNQEAHGPLTSLKELTSLHIPNFIIEGMYINGNYYHPTFFYESIWNLLGFIIMIVLRRTKKLKLGLLSGFYLIWYGIGRFFIEGARTDSLMFLNIKVAQLVSVLFIIIGIYLIIRKPKSKGEVHE